MHFCILRRNLRWSPKMAGKRYLGKVTSRLCIYPAGQKHGQNRPILHRFQDKCAFAFYVKMQDGCQKWRKAIFAKSCQLTLQIPCGSEILSKSIYLTPFQRKMWFYAEIQDDRKKWRESDFCKELPVDSRHPVGQKFCPHTSISHRFQDIKEVSFSALRKIVPFS